MNNKQDIFGFFHRHAQDAGDGTHTEFLHGLARFLFVAILLLARSVHGGSRLRHQSRIQASGAGHLRLQIRHSIIIIIVIVVRGGGGRFGGGVELGNVVNFFNLRHVDVAGVGRSARLV